MGKILNNNQNQNHEIYIENFEDMEEVKGNIYTGIGIKKMKGYICNLKIDELNNMREVFWKSKIDYQNENWKTWSTIKRAVTFDELRASILLEEYNIKTVNGCINHLVDSKGNYYKIPNYCINEPYFGKDTKDEKEVKNENIKIKIYGYKSIDMEINNKSKGKDLKDEIKMMENIGENKKIRIFIRGAEIQDDDFLYEHNLNEITPIMLLVN